MYVMTSGNPIVDAMGKINISGNVIPQIWYSTITRPNGKPYLLAITLLSDIVYWYRPVEVRDEQSGRVIGWKTRFKGQLLQKTYQQYADLYGESKRSIKAALDRLEELKVIKKEFHNVTYENGMEVYNLMFISLNADILQQLTYPNETPKTIEKIGETNEDTEAVEEIKEDSEDVGSITENSLHLHNNAEGELTEGDISFKSDMPPTKQCTTPYKIMYHPLQNNVPPPTKFCTTPLQNNVTPPTKFCRDTKNTTENTNRDYINQSIYLNNIILGAEDADEMDEMAKYAQFIKKNIEYDALKLDMGVQRTLVDEIVDLLTEIVCVKRDYIRINGADYPYQLVKSKLLKLDYSHIRYVLECMKKNTTKIGNIRSYLLTALFNASSTIDSYYQAEVNHDMYG